jgi:glycosyltransferase involved in cell wall biosynthesis
MESANDYREIVKQCEEIPIVVTEHRCMWLEGCRVYKQRKGKIRKLYGAAKKVICVSKMQEKYISENYEAQTIVIPNYIDKKFDYNPTKKECRFTFISVGTFEYRKRFDLTIRAFSIFYEKHSASRLILVGAGALLEDMKTLVKKLEMDDEIVFMERIKNDLMPDIYNKSHVFVLPSMDESFGVVYAEAASCGLPIIATACGGPIDIVNDNNGLLIPINDLNALVDAMEQIYCNYHKYDSYEISKDIQNRFGSESVIARIIECYKV